MKSKKEIVRKHIHGRILFQLFIFGIISAVMLGIVLYDVVLGEINILWALGGAIIGVVIGVVAGRIFAMKWHEDTQKVILSIDKMSIVLIGIYIVFRSVSNQIFGDFLHGQELTILTFSTLGGIMVGRMLSMLKGVIAILKKQKLL